MFLRLLHMIQRLVLSRFPERIQVLLPESLAAPAPLRRAFPQVDVHQNPQSGSSFILHVLTHAVGRRHERRDVPLASVLPL